MSGLRITEGHSQSAAPEINGCGQLQFSVSSGSIAYYVSLFAPTAKPEIRAETSKYSLPQTYSVDYFFGGHSFLDSAKYPGFPIFCTCPCLKKGKGPNCITTI